MKRSAFIIKHPKLTVLQGDMVDAACVAATIQEGDAVMSVLGPCCNKPELIISKGTNRLKQRG